MTSKELPDLEEFKNKNFDLNNFELNLPDDKGPAIPGEPKIRSGHSRGYALDLGWIDQSPSREKMDSSSIEFHSPLYLSQTYRSFFAAIDAAIEELNFNPIIADYFKRRTPRAYDFAYFTAEDEAQLNRNIAL